MWPRQLQYRLILHKSLVFASTVKVERLPARPQKCVKLLLLQRWKMRQQPKK